MMRALAAMLLWDKPTLFGRPTRRLDRLKAKAASERRERSRRKPFRCIVMYAV